MVKVRRRIFSPRLGPTLAALFMIAVLLGLGTWQVKRLAWKEALLVTINQHSHAAPVIATESLLTKNIDLDYRHGEARGILLHDHEFYQLAISRTGQGGYHVLTPLKLEDGGLLLVDRGWIPYDLRNANYIEAYNRPAGMVTIRGVLRLPQRPSWVQPRNDARGNNWYYVNLRKMAVAASVPAFLPYVLEAEASSNPKDYPIGGQTQFDLPNNHLQYAITWYTLAFILLVIYGRFSLKPADADKSEAVSKE